MTIVAVSGRRTADVCIIIQVFGVGGAGRRVATLIKEFTGGAMAICACGEAISYPGAGIGIMTTVDAAAVGVGEVGAGVVQGGGQVGAAEVDRTVFMVGATGAG